MKLLQQVMATNDSVVISMVVDALGTVPAVARRVGEILFAAHLPRFRAEGLWWLIKDDGPDSEGLVRSGLRDRAASVRDIAQRWMLRHGQDPAEHYRGLIHGDPVPAFRGLGDRPNLNDADLARAAAHSAVAAVRVAALRLLAGIGEEADGPLFAERFLHGSAKEGRHALEGLQRCGEANKMVDELWSTAVHQGDRRVVERVLTQVLPLVGRWKRLDIGLQAAASQDPAIAEAGLGSLWRTLAAWHNRYPTSGGDIERLRQRLETARPALTADPHREFRPNMLESLELLLR